MIFNFKCVECKKVFEMYANPADDTIKQCPHCGGNAIRQFHACTNIYVPSYFHTSRSDIFTDKEWQDLKRNPDIERA